MCVASVVPAMQLMSVHYDFLCILYSFDEIAACLKAPTREGVACFLAGDVLAAVASGTEPSAKQTEEQQQQQQQQSKPSKSAARQPEKRAAAAKPATEAAQQQSSTAQQPRQSGDSKIRAILAAKLMEDGKPIPVQWLIDWVGPSQQQHS